MCINSSVILYPEDPLRPQVPLSEPIMSCLCVPRVVPLIIILSMQLSWNAFLDASNQGHIIDIST
jgi:hypothetical protein